MKINQIVTTLGLSVAASTGLFAATSSERYVYDASGNIVEKQIGAEVTQFAYEGNLLKVSLSHISKQYQYDGAGRLVDEMEEGQVVRTLSYQFLDKVSKVQNGEKTSVFFYNAEGELVGASSRGKLEAFAWDGLAMVLHGESLFVNESSISGGASALVNDTVAVTDHLGSSLSIGRNDIVATAYGEGAEEGFYTGKPFIDGIGFVFKYRNYNPMSGRWLSSDPSGYPNGRNNYSYVNGRPLEAVDPNGLAEITLDGPNDNADPGDGNLGSQTETQWQDDGANTTKAVLSWPCHVRESDSELDYQGETTINIRGQGIYMGAIVNSDTVTAVKKHELWHFDHDVTLGEVSWGHLETFWKGYRSNQFNTPTQASNAASIDWSVNLGRANDLWTDNKDRTLNHEGGGTFEPDGTSGTWVVPNGGNWGATLNATLSGLSWVEKLETGNCEL